MRPPVSLSETKSRESPDPPTDLAKQVTGLHVRRAIYASRVFHDSVICRYMQGILTYYETRAYYCTCRGARRGAARAFIFFALLRSDFAFVGNSSETV
jgi:hypothetical protein